MFVRALGVALTIFGVWPTLSFAADTDFASAFAKAAAAEKQAEQLQNRWTTTEALLKTAQKEHADHNDTAAVAAAQQAQAMAEASIAQARTAESDWRSAVIK